MLLLLVDGTFSKLNCLTFYSFCNLYRSFCDFCFL